MPSCSPSRLALVLLAFCGPAAAAAPLPSLQAAREGTTVSGVSSGGYMAVQLHVAHSATIRGVAALAAGPYYCAQGSLWTAYNHCMTPGAWTPLPATSLLKQRTDLLAGRAHIDPPSNLAGARVWLFSGRNDRTVRPEVVAGLRAFYEAYKANPALVGGLPAGHAMITTEEGNACEVTAPPFINDCDFDAAGELLRHLLGPLQPAASAAGGSLVAFDQDAFAGGDAAALSMASRGFVYVPKDCAKGICRVHIAFHGCRQGVDEVEERFARQAGYNRWADTNRLIVLYPQATARSGFSFGAWNYVWNPRGCWDWWGYTGAQYHTKQGAQLRAVMGMLKALSGPRK